MANNQDSRPFVDLQKDADEFQAKFEEDIEKCKSTLDAKITALICDPDSLGNSLGPKQNALVEFSKAKYDIYISMKSLMNDMEREWLKYISAMKKLFIDNVEVFLANTKLEVKLPSSESQSSLGPRKPLFSKKSSSVTSSVYPILSSITKSIPGFSQKNKSLDFKETEMDLNSSWSSCKSRKSTKLGSTSADLNKSWSFSSQKDNSNGRVHFGSSPALSFKNEISDDEDDEEKQSSFHDSVKGLDNQYLNENLKQNSFQGIPPKKISSFENQEETRDFQSGLTHANPRKSIRSSTRSKSATITKNNSTNTSNENEEVNGTETNNNMSSRRPRRIQAPKRQPNAQTLEQGEKVPDPVCEEKSVTSVIPETRRGRPAATRKGKKNAALEPDKKITEAEIQEVLNGTSVVSETRKGRSATTKNSENISTGTSVISETRRGRPAATRKVQKSAEPDKEVTEAVIEEKRNGISAISETHKGRSATTKNAENVSDETVRIPGRSGARKAGNETVMETDETVRMPGRSGARKAVNETVMETDKTIRMPGRLSARRTVNETVVETDIYNPAARPTKAAARRKTVLPSLDEDISDIYAPAARPTKSAGRRKTLLSNLDEDMSDPDIIPGYHTSARSKRKTISGVSDLSSVAPSKGLKSSNTGKNKAAASDDGAAADNNLLEINDSYSDWITLKSINGKIPTSPAIYEVKVWRAKKSAYIGCCDNLRQMLTLHKLQQNSGHKHLDKFIERNYDDIQIRYEVVSSMNEAKVEVKNRVNNFVAMHKTTPAYN